MSLLFAALHLVSLVFGVGAFMFRAQALQQANDTAGARKVLFWDNIAGVVALFWVGSGLWRAFGGLEKGSEYYLSNHVFWLKALLVLALLGIELTPMTTFIRWRIRLAKQQPIDLSKKARLVRLHWYELALVPLIVVCAVLMTRGVGVVKKRASAEVAALDTRAESTYFRQCSSCHQLDGRGLNGRLAADFVGDASRLAKPDSVLLRSIAEGVPGTAMVGFNGRLTDEEQRAVLQYLRAKFGKH